MIRLGYLREKHFACLNSVITDSYFVPPTLSDSSFSTSFLILRSMKGFRIMCSLESWSATQTSHTNVFSCRTRHMQQWAGIKEVGTQMKEFFFPTRRKTCFVPEVGTFSSHTSHLYSLSSIADLFSAWLSMSLENHSLNSSWESNNVGIMKWSSAHSWETVITLGWQRFSLTHTSSTCTNTSQREHMCRDTCRHTHKHTVAHLSHGVLNGRPSEQQTVSTLELKEYLPTNTTTTYRDRRSNKKSVSLLSLLNTCCTQTSYSFHFKIIKTVKKE